MNKTIRNYLKSFILTLLLPGDEKEKFEKLKEISESIDYFSIENPLPDYIKIVLDGEYYNYVNILEKSTTLLFERLI